MVVKKNIKKYYSYEDDINSIKDLMEEKKREIKEIESRMKKLTKTDTIEDGEETERDRLKRQIKHLEKEIRNLQRNL